MAARQNVRVGHNNDALRGITSEEPGRQSHRCAQRFQVSWRQGDDQTAYLAASHLRQFVGHRFEVPVWLEGDAGPDHAKSKLGKRRQVVRKQGLQDNLRGIIGQAAGVEGHWAWQSVLLLILRVIVQELRRSENRRRGNHLVVLSLDIGQRIASWFVASASWMAWFWPAIRSTPSLSASAIRSRRA